MMHADGLTDQDILAILDDTRRIAVIGLSDKPDRASYQVTQYLVNVGFIVVGVNPALAGQEVAGAFVYGSLDAVPGPIDLVDVFRRHDALPEVAIEVADVARNKGIGYLWLQLGLASDAAAQTARDANVTIVMDRCLKVEHARLQAAITSSRT